MNNLYDYIKYYKNFDFEEINFNTVDALIYSVLIYLPINELSNGSTPKEINYTNETQYNKNNIQYHAIEILKEIKNSKRYQNIKLYNLEKIENNEMQFGAITIRHNNITFIAFEGSNGSIIGWKENLNLSCEYPTATQKEAANYLNKVIKFTDQNIYVGGHSKGGNMAMAACMECNKNISKRIKKIFNFDGPGFRKKEFNSEKFKQMNQKLYNVIPDGSLVGILLNNMNYHYIKTSGIGFEKHRPINWHLFGEFFIENKISDYSKEIHEKVNKNIEQLNENDVKKLIEELYKFFENNNIRTTKDISKTTDLKNIIYQINEVDDKTKKTFFDIAKILLTNTKYQ